MTAQPLLSVTSYRSACRADFEIGLEDGDYSLPYSFLSHYIGSNGYNRSNPIKRAEFLNIEDSLDAIRYHRTGQESSESPTVLNIVAPKQDLPCQR